MSMEVFFDTTKTGLETLMVAWRAEVLRYIWSRGGESFINREVWEHVSPLYGVSRTSINQFLKRLTEMGLLKNRPVTGRGGIHGNYSLKLSEEAFGRYVARTILNKLLEVFPKEAGESIEEYCAKEK